jgi:hypothetical protein
VIAARSAQSSARIQILRKNVLQGVHGSRNSTKSQSDSIKNSKDKNRGTPGGRERILFKKCLNLSLTNFPEKKEVLGRLKSLKRSSTEGITLYKKCEQDPRNGLAGRTKVEAFESLDNLLILKKV